MRISPRTDDLNALGNGPQNGPAGMKETAMMSAGLRRFLDLQQEREWMQGKTILRDAEDRSESLELRLKYVARFEKLLRRPQAQEVLKILRRYGRNCIPIPRRTERHYWSVSCLP